MPCNKHCTFLHHNLVSVRLALLRAGEYPQVWFGNNTECLKIRERVINPFGGVGDSLKGFPLRNLSSGSCQLWSIGSTFIHGPIRSVGTNDEKIWLGFTPSSMVERMYSSFYISKVNNRDFPGGPVVKTSPSNAGVWVRSLVGELDPTCLTAKKPKHKTETTL